MDDDLEVVLVSYDKDFERARDCVASIRRYGILNRDVKIHLIVNDEREVFDKFQSWIVGADVYHHSQISDWKHELGWWSQQWFKLSVAKIVSTEWYMIIDSDIIQTQSVYKNDCFKDQKAYCRLNSTDVYDTTLPHHAHFRRFLDNACRKWEVPLESVDKTLREVPPALFHTRTVNEMLTKCDQTIFYRKQTCEFFLYWIYVLSCNLQDALYINNPKWFNLGTTFRSH